MKKWFICLWIICLFIVGCQEKAEEKGDLTAVSTLAPPTLPAPTQTHSPTATHAPTSETAQEDIAPYASAPPCPDHDPTVWHSLWDSQRGCYYTHEHKHDPNDLNHLFGKPGEWFGGGEISYPWQTFSGANADYPQIQADSVLENEAKHNGYGWIVRQDIPPHSDIWIKDFRLQYHAISAPPGTLTRFHSFSLEANICQQADMHCGLIRTGGWIDFGNLEIRGTGAFPLTGEADAVDDDGRRRIHFFYTDPEIRTGDADAGFFWYGRVRPASPPFRGPLEPFSIALATADAWANVDANDVNAPNLFCPDFQCEKNGSTIQAHVVQFGIPEANLNIFTDRYGLPARDCQTIGLDCIPLIIEEAPIGRVQHRDDRDLGLSTAGTQDFDISPEGVWWIEYPN